MSDFWYMVAKAWGIFVVVGSLFGLSIGVYFLATQSEKIATPDVRMWCIENCQVDNIRWCIATAEMYDDFPEEMMVVKRICPEKMEDAE